LSAYAASLCQHVTADCHKSVGHRWRFLATAYRIPHLADRTSLQLVLLWIMMTSTSPGASSVLDLVDVVVVVRNAEHGRAIAFVIGLQSTAGTSACSRAPLAHS
jgi:hypothetical protein